MLKLSHVSVKIAGAEVLRDVSMDLRPKAFVALVGRNGAGKTTLMRSVMGLLPISSGQIFIDGQNATYQMAFARARNGIGYLPEDRRLVPDWTVEQNIRLPSWASQKADIELKLERIYWQIPEVAQFRQRKALELSGGQQKLVALARAFMASKNLLILDEPFEGVAPVLVQRLVEILSDLRRQNALSVLISESDGTNSQHLVDYNYAIERGRVTVS
ncbi:ATP-binding cassette domain-containing protein [Bradyrhizobium sp. NP1]|uniref:ATP-binding cassette domain-containing protein n=1 Tax=Bradyrhizobium sp. NP1 TaxID=3049772 RepID=UPI0025A5294E|nr:ATP-binding cassette domain-containing protein [Bradyrhizobium sp. NP1]WJR79234.1 ATP-binding cassette domain-containing protein [Bradyrhizobium sp. NP1]